MQVRVEDIQAFALTAELKSFHRAAEELNITQSALSRRLKKLEDFVGARLLDRTSRVVTLTVVGAEFLPTAKRMVLEFENALSGIRDLIEKRSGAVVMSCNMTMANTIMPEVLSRFCKVHPRVQIRMIEDSSPKVGEAVSSGEAEFGVAQAASDHPGTEFEPVVEDPVMLVAPEGHPLGKKKQIQWADLGNYDFISMSATSGTQRLLAAALDHVGLMPKGQFEVAHMPALLGLVGAGIGISAIPYTGTLQRRDVNLIMRPLIKPKVSRTIGIISRRGRTLSPGAEALRKIVCEVLIKSSNSIQSRNRKAGKQTE